MLLFRFLVTSGISRDLTPDQSRYAQPMALPRITTNATSTTAKHPTPTNNYGVVGGVSLSFPLSDILGSQQPGQKSPSKRKYVVDYKSHASTTKMFGSPRPLGSLPRRKPYITDTVGTGMHMTLPALSSDGGHLISTATKSSSSFPAASRSPPGRRNEAYRVSVMKNGVAQPTNNDSIAPPQRPQTRVLDAEDDARMRSQVEVETKLVVDMNFCTTTAETADLWPIELDSTVDEPQERMRHFSPPTARVSSGTSKRPRTASAPEPVSVMALSHYFRFVLFN